MESGDPYYYNSQEQTTQWDVPEEVLEREAEFMPPKSPERELEGKENEVLPPKIPELELDAHAFTLVYGDLKSFESL